MLLRANRCCHVWAKISKYKYLLIHIIFIFNHRKDNHLQNGNSTLQVPFVDLAGRKIKAWK